MSLAGQIIEGVLWTFIGLLWIRFIVDWVQVFARSWEPRGVLLVLLEIVYSITDPPIKALGRVVKPIRIGNFALDLSFILVMILAYVALAVNRQIFFT
ncbi:YggT family protein [Nocardioides bizhenqiangii]|uniref:YggT family protein n=1 Tax=Nocardioides bizhenqiangii TaxID=3095076 RepID=A0ABZ0ZLS5_9ACTN|nr:MULTISPECIES: YggT family protein [unclassified Nocardioides]MDZ5620638.1 YggT family protein [Nocardioides sp. HM23]WQQ25005.1 YggT family protein [Nocardioides sp. HM61]